MKTNQLINQSINNYIARGRYRCRPADNQQNTIMKSQDSQDKWNKCVLDSLSNTSAVQCVNSVLDRLTLHSCCRHPCSQMSSAELLAASLHTFLRTCADLSLLASSATASANSPYLTTPQYTVVTEHGAVVTLYCSSFAYYIVLKSFRTARLAVPYEQSRTAK